MVVSIQKHWFLGLPCADYDMCFVYDHAVYYEAIKMASVTSVQLFIAQQSIVMSASVCLCVCLSATISSELQVWSSPIFSYMLAMAVARSSSGGVEMMGFTDGSGISWTIMQTICTALQTDNHTNTSSLKFYRPGSLPDAQPKVSKHWRWMRLSGNNSLSLAQFLLQLNMKLYAFSALTLLVGRQEEHPACKNWLMRCWCGYLSVARRRLFAYGPADATASKNPIISCLI